MPSRRKHQKSRNGCIPCKERKVKCDERRPSCSRCLQRQNPCQYNITLVISQASTPSSRETLHPPSQPTLDDDFWNNVFPSSGPPPSEQGGSASNNFRDHDLELLHHYSTSTYFTLANGFSLEGFWQVIMPKLGFSNLYLMHGVLALSACHLLQLRLESAEYYSGLAVNHHIAAVSLFRSELDNIDEQNALPVLGFSMLVAVLSFAMPQENIRIDAPEPVFVKGMLDTFRLVRGVKHVAARTYQYAEDSYFAPLMKLPLPLTEGPLDFHAETAVRELEARINSVTEPLAMKNDYLDAVATFRRCYPRGTFVPQHQSLVSAWPVMVRDSFFNEMLNMKPGIALVILGYYGVLLHFMRGSWWIHGRGKKLVEGAVSLLTPEWQPLMSWPKEIVGIA